MQTPRLELSALPPGGCVLVLEGVTWPEDSFEVLAFLNVPRDVAVESLREDHPCFVGPFFLYGSGVPRPAYGASVGLHVRLRVSDEVVARCGRPGPNALTLVARDAEGRLLDPKDLRVQDVTIEV